MFQFKEGDRVECVDASDTFNKLAQGATYTVLRTHDNGGVDLVEMQGKCGTHSNERFRLVTQAGA